MFLYFSVGEAPNISPEFSGMWRTTAQATRRVLKPDKTKDAITATVEITGLAVANTATLSHQYISPGLLGDQTIAGRISGQLMVREYATTDNMDQVILCAKVYSNNGATQRGTLLASGNYGPTAEFVNNATHRNKTIASGQTLSTVNALDGDRIVIEIGFKNTTAGTTPGASAKWGTAAPDLPVNETQTTNGAGWIQIPDLKFRSTQFMTLDSSD